VRLHTDYNSRVSLAPYLDQGLRNNLGPERVMKVAGGPEDEFLEHYGDTQFLLVKLQPGLEALELGLTTIQRVAVQPVLPSIRVMGFETAILTEQQVLELELGEGSEAARIERLRWLLRNDRYFVLPLRKRTEDATFMDRVSLGRSTNKDIVLRHPNVSKFHAWFEMDEQSALYVADAEATNGTLLNGKKLAPRELTRVSSGDHLRFGSVECVACDPAEFWRAIRPD
jgi:hypothetical protein